MDKLNDMLNREAVHRKIGDPILIVEGVLDCPVFPSRHFEDQWCQSFGGRSVKPRGRPKRSLSAIANGNYSSRIKELPIGIIVRGFGAHPRFIRSRPLVP
jgi:hypothetical protein